MIRKSELLATIKEELEAGNRPGTSRVIDLLDLLIAQGGATLGDITNMRKQLGEKNV
tara:strand:+ start:90 stop:260 length:171 start_codon:yes stop_codon:yes gene_type:complete